MDGHPTDPGFEETLPLRDRLPDYAAVFGVGLAISAAVGLVIALVWRTNVAAAVGYTIVAYGIVLLLAGGATGGGYTNLGVGAVGAMFGTRRTDEAEDDMNLTAGGRPRMDPRDRLKKGLRPEANPRAFWQVMAGVTYIVVGVVIAANLG
jgi:hypothetical protein